MKKIITLLAVLISLTFSLEIIASNNQVVAKSSGFSSIDGNGVATFVVTSPVTQNCDLSFLMMPGEYEDGSFTSVTLKVNGITLPNPITFNTYGWQPANTIGNAVTLNEGDNIVEFISGRDDVPMIREVKKFDATIQNFTTSVMSLRNNISSSQMSRDGFVWDYYSSRPVYRDGMEINQPYYNTFILPIGYGRGDIATFYVQSNTSTVDFNMYLFNIDPGVYSKSATCDSSRYLYFQDLIPIDGIYYLLLEAKNNGECGGVTIHVNNDVVYRNAFVSNTSFDVFKGDDINQVTNRNLPYNLFTTNLRSADDSREADSFLYLKQEPEPGKEIVVAFSDNNRVVSDFDWGNNARIRTYLADMARYRVGLCSMYPSYFIPDTCDVYHSFWNSVDTTYYSNPSFHNRFPNLKYEDVIESDIAGQYNCYAWVAGLTRIEVLLNSNSMDEGLELFDALFLNDTLPHALTGNIARPPGSIRYIRSFPGDENAVVDIWGDFNDRGEIIRMNHGSIRNTINTPMHGYDWESKDGLGPRFFHPRFSIGGNFYGERIVASYKIHPEDLSKTNNSPEFLMYNAISEGSLIIEDIVLTDEDKLLLEQNITPQTTYSTDRFETYYNQWIEYAKPLRRYSNFALFKDSVYYPQIRDYILSNPEVEYRVYKKFADGDIPAIVLMKDIASIENTKAKRVWDEIFETPLEKGVMRTTWSNVNLFIKTMLQEDNDVTQTETGKIRSNENDVVVASISGGVNIRIGLEKISKYVIKLINYQTSQQSILLRESIHQPGIENYQYSLNPGIYIISVEIDGNINAHKVLIK